MKDAHLNAKAAVVVATLFLLTLATSAFGMNKAELVDAVASGAKLTKADAGRVVDAILGTVAGTLASAAQNGGTDTKISLSGFGAFSVSVNVPPDSESCVPVAEPGFDPANAFTRLINPIAMDKGLRFRVETVDENADGVVATGVVMSGTASVGDAVTLQNGVGAVGGITGGVIAGIVVAGAAVSQATEGQTASLLLRGIEKKDIKRGMVILKPPSRREPGPPLSPCFNHVVDEGIAAAAGKVSGLRFDLVLAALEVMKQTIMDTVASGYAVDIDGFGVFYVLGEHVLSATDPGTDLPTGGVKKAVKFKAGAELAKTVNK